MTSNAIGDGATTQRTRMNEFGSVACTQTTRLNVKEEGTDQLRWSFPYSHQSTFGSWRFAALCPCDERSNPAQIQAQEQGRYRQRESACQPQNRQQHTSQKRNQHTTHKKTTHKRTNAQSHHFRLVIVEPQPQGLLFEGVVFGGPYTLGSVCAVISVVLYSADCGS